jgi:hypothetical protein
MNQRHPSLVAIICLHKSVDPGEESARKRGQEVCHLVEYRGLFLAAPDAMRSTDHIKAPVVRSDLNISPQGTGTTLYHEPVPGPGSAINHRLDQEGNLTVFDSHCGQFSDAFESEPEFQRSMSIQNPSFLLPGAGRHPPFDGSILCGTCTTGSLDQWDQMVCAV